MQTSSELFKKRTLSQSQHTLPNFKLGDSGELQAIKLLIDKNYKILERNIRLKNNEVDIIAIDTENNDLVFVEVKTRTTDFFGNPSQAVNKKKIASMQKVARAYLATQKWERGFRFDVITILPDSIEHFENITW
jgi:putative endonuclease